MTVLLRHPHTRQVYAHPEYVDALGTSMPIADHVHVDFELRGCPGNVCVMVAHGAPCLGPVTHAGCGALCPGYERGCYRCYGPSDAPQTAPLARRFLAQGVSRRDVGRLFLTFNANAPAFRAEGTAHDE